MGRVLRRARAHVYLNGDRLELRGGSGSGGGRGSGARVDVYDVTSDGSLGARLETFSAFGVDAKEGVFVAAGAYSI